MAEINTEGEAVARIMNELSSLSRDDHDTPLEDMLIDRSMEDDKMQEMKKRIRQNQRNLMQHLCME